MTENTGKTSPIMGFLHAAFPGRTDEQVVPIGLIYAGVRWGRDFRFGAVPKDEYGQPILICRSEREYVLYLFWLADYLYKLGAEPSEEQSGLCRYAESMQPEDAILLIGMNAALYQFDVEPMESWIEDDEPFSAYLEHMYEYVVQEGEEYDEEAERVLYERVRVEMQECQEHCSQVDHADIGYRVPLSKVLKKREKSQERHSLLHKYYQTYDKYLR
jgi:hypothetical protein